MSAAKKTMYGLAGIVIAGILMIVLDLYNVIPLNPSWRHIATFVGIIIGGIVGRWYGGRSGETLS